MKKKIEQIYNMFSTRQIGILPAGLAFSFVFSVIPIISLLFYLVTSFNFSMDFMMDILKNNLPSGVFNLLQPVLIGELSISSIVTIACGLIVTINGCNSIIVASNTIYEVENAPYYKRIFKSILITIIIFILLIFMIVIVLLGKSILNVLINNNILNINEALLSSLYRILQIPVAMIVIFLLVKLIYIIAPDRKVPSGSTNLGAFTTTVFWIIITVGFSYYINNIARYDLIYGNLANLAMIMFWFYLLAYILVIGMILNKRIVNDSIDKTNTIKLEEVRKKVNNLD